MNSKTPCPSDDALRRCLAEAYRGGDAGATRDHVRDCAPCRQRAEVMLKTETRFSEVRIAQSVAGRSVNASVVDAILRQPAKPPSIAPTSKSNAAPADDLDFLDPPDPAHPTDLGLFDRYRIVRKLGQGGMGMVFHAVDTTLDRTVALKIILPQYAGDEGLRERFLQEAQATVKVRSPHVAEVYDCGVWNNVPYLTMELLVGVTLDQKPKPMALDAWRRIAFGIAKGLSDAHRAGLVHRDLKPGNIHLGTDSRTNKPTVKIIDFGLARPVDRKVEMTKSGVMLGTPAYMSLEQARGDKVDHRTDLYSLGVILYQLATGKLPYSNTSSVMAILAELATAEPLPSVALGAPDLPPSLVELVDRLLEKDASRRPGSADEVMRALKASLSGDASASAAEVAPVVATPVLARAVPVRDAERTAGPHDERTMVELMPMGARARPSRRRPSRERERAPRRSLWRWLALSGVGGTVVIVAILFATGAFSNHPDKGSATDAGSRGGPDAPTRLAPMNWAELPNLIDATPRWQPIESATAERIRAARTNAIKDVPSFEAKTLGEHMMAQMSRVALTGALPPGLFPPSPLPGDPNSLPPTLAVPSKILLSGDLVGIRTHADKTWIILAGSVGGPMNYGRSVGCLVEFKTANLALHTMDYRAGDRVRILATRAPREELRAIVSPQAPAEVRDLILETRYVLKNASPQAFWSLRGEGMEKANQAGTWIDATLGRAETPTNEPELRRSPTFFVRDRAAAGGTRGRIAGAFRAMGKSETGVSFTLQLGNTAEGAPLLHCYMTGASLEEFIDYGAGDSLEADVAISAPPPAPHAMPAFGPGPGASFEGFSLDTALQAECLSVRKVGKPETTVVQFGERRANLPAVKTTPDSVYANPAGHVGARVTWTGPLKKIRALGDSTHLLVGVTGSIAGLTNFEARVAGTAFLDELSDFVTSDESTGKADTVTVTGVVESPPPGVERLEPTVPLLQLDRIERPGDNESAAVSGRKRDPKSFRAANVLDPLTKFQRHPPPVGTAIRFSARYSSFNSYNLTIYLNPAPKTHSGGIHVKMTGATDAALKDYKTGDLVDVEAVVENVDNSSDRPKLRGKSVVRKANARSLITETGRAIPPLDFTAVERLWNDVRYVSNPNATDPLRGGGVFESYAALEGRLKIVLKNAFFQYSNLDLYCADTPVNRKALDALKAGDELIFEAKSIAPPPGKSSSSYRELDADWIAPIGTPDKKIEFKPKP
ncbi:MAG: serine/threonine protein kinase [Gemmataceae bacterium]|nr:serine/threonine protein kinase [Gemmataceae bacterium]